MEEKLSNSNKIYIVIPAFNEEKVIGKVIQSIKGVGFHNILVVNDGSTDNTEKIAGTAGAEVLNHIINRGQGAALRTGIEYLRETIDPDIIVTFDADGQHQPSDIQKLIEPIFNNEYDIVLGSRFLGTKSNAPLMRKFILRAGVVFTNLVSRINLSDTNNGLRALGKKAIWGIDITQRRMEHASEIIDEITKKKLHWKEVPVHIIYTSYSKARKNNTNLNFIKIGIKILIKKITE